MAAHHRPCLDCRITHRFIISAFGLFGAVAAHGIFSDTLAHGALLGVALAVWLQLPTDLGIGIISILVIIALTILKDKRLPNDAILAVLASTLLCLGLLTLTQLTQQQANVLGFLFGSLLDIDWADLPRLAVMIFVGLIILAAIRRLKLSSPPLRRLPKSKASILYSSMCFLWVCWPAFVQLRYRRSAVC